MTSTAKNYAGQNLRGRSFKGQDLSGADFTDADLRGANFTNAILRGANFSKVDTGVQKRWFAFQLIISFFLAIFSGYLAAYIGVWTTLFFARYYIENSRIEGIAMIIIVILIFFAIIRQGFTSAAFGMIAGAFALVAYVSVLLGTGSVAIVLAGAVLASVIVVLSWTFALLGTRSLVVWSGLFAGALSGKLSAAVGAAWGGSSVSFEFSLAGAVILAVGTASLSGYAAWRTLKGDRKFDKMLKFSVAFASICGTSFRGADLTKANFTKAYLKCSDFRNSRKQSTNLTRVIWNQAKELERSRLGTSILSNPEVRELLVTGKPNQTLSYEGLNLRGANLDGAYLKEVNFKRAILNEASFRNANLESANLTEAQVIGTDFTGAQMTGACLEGWSYDRTTKLDDVE